MLPVHVERSFRGVSGRRWGPWRRQKKGETPPYEETVGNKLRQGSKNQKRWVGYREVRGWQGKNPSPKLIRHAPRNASAGVAGMRPGEKG